MGYVAMKQANATALSPPVLSIACITAIALAYEILLMRLFSIIQWHHYTYMIISLALLGYGLSGAVIALNQRWLLARFERVFLANLCLFGLSAVGCFLLAQQIPFHAEEMLWDFRQTAWLFLAYILLSLPFFFAANAVALAMTRYQQLISRIYAYDMAGAGIGSLAIIGLLFIVNPLLALYILGSLALLVALLASWELRPKTVTLLWWLQSRTTYIITTLTVSIVALWIWTYDDLQLSTYKGLSQTLRITARQVVAEHSSPLGLINVVESPVIPLRYAPGLSLNAQMEPPAQLGIFTDGEGMSAITRFPQSLNELAYLDQMTTAAPYQFRKLQRVLILGAGGGKDVLQALLHKVPEIDAVELNPQIIKLVRKDYAEYAGNIYGLDNVRIHTADARGYVTSSDRTYDLIQLALLDAFGASGTGLYALHENYLYTVEALKTYLQHLSPDGYLALSRWTSIPPRDTLKLFVTAIDALRESGMPDPARQLLLIRSWQTSTLIIKNGVINDKEITGLKEFCDKNAFDLIYYPGIIQQEANRYNKLPQADFFIGAQALLSEQRQTFLARYKFNLQPASDDKPYYFNFFKWSTLPELLNLRNRGGLALVESGYLVLIAVLIQAILASLLLILLPHWLMSRQKKTIRPQINPARIVVYFSALGLAFLFIEIAFIQKFILFLHHPMYAASVVLSSFLIFAGLGSAWSRQKQTTFSLMRSTGYAIIGIVCLSLIYLLGLGAVFEGLMTLPIWGKVAVTIILIVPLAFCMGIPFPSALTRLGELAPNLIPWAWGINGCASVLSAVLATLIAIHAGFSTVIVMAGFLYLVAWLTFPKSQN